ncbi:histidine phosphatase family protein [Methylobacterium sp. Leaf93]|uniref:SixA phosphatase family protein n=1 Tax=Methylobacterium sp. Leaf93 TaxID=1736249 RepID=UPI0007003974|nr:histidine phosphatase family protein [Methylobacterium sp. Leaf93]KQP15726.1 phosphoglycerate mutase [Methylobacterium sp. Leaf93]
MRRLMLLRHAKSDRSPGVRDIDRPLNPRGVKAAPQMGAYLAAQDLIPRKVVVSPSLRTRQTWEGMSAALGNPETEIVDAIYEAPDSALLEVIRATPADIRTLLMIGHNPGLQDLSLDLVGDGPREARARLSVEFPTAALAVIDIEGDAWTGFRHRAGRLDRFVTPKGLDRDDAA